MPTLFGSTYSPDSLRRQTSTIGQIAGIQLREVADGKARGMRVAEVYTGSGLRFTVLLDRALDIGAAEYGGTPLAWVHPALGGPELYDAEGAGWVRTWGGGLVTTCGLTHFGQPEQDGPEALGLHGRIAHTRGENIAITQEWQGDDYVLAVSGQARQVVMGGENLLLTRRISTRLGATSLLIEDTVRNEGLQPSPHMILYHCNFGFPVISPDSELLLGASSVRPRDAAAAAGLADYRHFAPPQDEYPEQVFFHTPPVEAGGWVRAALVNRALGFGASLAYRAAELPCLGQWKMLAAGTYVCALEPANYHETPRARLREEGRLRYLAPGEQVQYALEIGALPDAAAITAWEAGRAE